MTRDAATTPRDACGSISEMDGHRKESEEEEGVIWKESEARVWRARARGQRGALGEMERVCAVVHGKKGSPCVAPRESWL